MNKFLQPTPLTDGVYRLLDYLLLSPQQQQEPLYHHRFIELVRRFFPVDAKELLEQKSRTWSQEEYPQLDSISLHALVAVSNEDIGAASLYVMDMPTTGGVQELVQGKMAVQNKNYSFARDILVKGAAKASGFTGPLSVEVEAEILSQLLRIELYLKEPYEKTKSRLDELLTTHKADVSKGIQDYMPTLFSEEVLGTMEKFILIRVHSQLKGAYEHGFMDIKESIAPIPLAVHGALYHHKEDPAAYRKAIIHLTALAWRLGYGLEAYRYLVFGTKIGERVYGTPEVAEIKAFQNGLKEFVTDDFWKELENNLMGVQEKPVQ